MRSWLNDSKLSTISFSWNSFSRLISGFLFIEGLHETTGVLKNDGRDIESVWIVGIGCKSHFNVRLLTYLRYLDSKCSTQITEFEVGVHSFRLTK